MEKYVTRFLRIVLPADMRWRNQVAVLLLKHTQLTTAY
jgi:hypothetical protein